MNYVLVKTRITNGLISLETKYNDPPRGTGLLSGTILLQSASSLRQELPSGILVSSLKHKISKREYKDVLSKTYIRTTLLMLMYQGKR